MKRIWLATLVGIPLLLSFLASSTHSQVSRAGRSGTSNRRVLFYRDPMHPSYTSVSPGKAPDCGMELIPVYADAYSPTHADLVQVSPEVQQLIGVQLGRVEGSTTTGILRALGRVVLDETRVFPVIASTDGWVTEVLAGTTGSIVLKGQPLVSVYGREYTTAQRTLLYALKTMENAPPVVPGDYQDQPALTLREARLNLENMGFGESQIQQITKSRQVMLNVTLGAPAAGVIVSRNIFPKQEFQRGSELYRVADLSHIWVVADLFSDDTQFVQSGAKARILLPHQANVSLLGTVSEALPRFDAGSRTMKMRIEVDNPKLVLRPDMFVDLEFSIQMPDAITVPGDAIVESGLQETVFVARDLRSFERRRVQTGWRFANRVQILGGLTKGESIVVSGNFLLNSESRMRSDPHRHD